MDHWFQEHCAAAQREVVSMQREGASARAVVTRRAYATSLEDLWDSIAAPHRLQRWFLPVSGDLLVGGKYQLEGNAGGTITRCDAPHHLALTWEMQGEIGWVNIELESIDAESTLLSLEHIARESAQYLEFWQQFGPGALGVGWDLALTSLADYILNGVVTFAADENTWVKTDVGQEFVKIASEGWMIADTAFGTDAQAAREAGLRTWEFYTGLSV